MGCRARARRRSAWRQGTPGGPSCPAPIRPCATGRAERALSGPGRVPIRWRRHLAAVTRNSSMRSRQLGALPTTACRSQPRARRICAGVVVGVAGVDAQPVVHGVAARNRSAGRVRCHSSGVSDSSSSRLEARTAASTASEDAMGRS